ncbi:CpsB/CapC family capsule biosynthesis tyrosine phosphatase [Rhodoferax sp.]|uniref:tyrosine-protein phosphatase n=1 Tax=Rhodoferax sp. TaxID=50421 RepID=UPI002616439F|nr:CpsB/CapC family capsule biosynthesis tyrosine phosphatase [Rhodoferax sp.]MDD2920243.1 capsular biosynthesis protein [Rhodoferax sp.]
MIDLHSHILPGVDDGAKDLATSLEMARIAVADGIHTMACTPHIYPGMYLNDATGIALARARLQADLDERGIALKLVVGADVHLVPGLLDGLRTGLIPTLNGSRYLLLEPSHTMPPPRFEDSVFNLVAAGYTPIITHPERLTWVEDHYPVFVRLVQQGAWMQVTAGALTGAFGPRAKYWADRFVADGHAHILATDAHSTGRRLPQLTPALDVVTSLIGAHEAVQLVVNRPQAVLENLAPVQRIDASALKNQKSWLRRLFAGL